MPGSKRKRTTSATNAYHEKDELKPPSQATKRQISPVPTNGSKRYKRTAIVRGSTAKDDSMFVGSADDNRRLRSNSVFSGNVQINNYQASNSTASSWHAPSSGLILGAASKARSNKRSVRSNRRHGDDSADVSGSDDTRSSPSHSYQSSSCEIDRGRSSECRDLGLNDTSLEDSGSEEMDRPGNNRRCDEANLVAEQLATIRRNIDSAMKYLQPKNKRKGKKASKLPGEDELRKIRRYLSGLRAQTLVPDERDLELFRQRVFESKNGQEGGEDLQQMEKLLKELELALRESKSLKKHGEKIGLYLPSRGGLNLYQEELHVEFAKCNRTIREDVKPRLASFQYLFHTFCVPKENDYSIQIANTLQKFKDSRKASVTLYHQLSKVCDLHPNHDTYFNLETGRRGKQGRNNAQNNEIVFHIAVERKDEHKGCLVLLEANSKVPVTPRESPDIVSDSLQGSGPRLVKRTRSRSVLPDAAPAFSLMHGAMFCIGKLPSGMDFEFRVGVNFMHHPDRHININLAGREPVRLSEWITASAFRDRQSRVRLARLISEAVLKFDPRLWRETKLQTDKLMIIDPLKYSQIESHISVPLRRQSGPSTASLDDTGIDRYNKAEAAVPVGEVILNLGVTLLELANLEIISRPAPEYRRTNPETWPKLEDGRLEREMGPNYAGAVRYCFRNCDSKDNMYDWKMQVEFYKEVVQLLKLDEEVGSQPFAKLEEAGQAHSKSSQIYQARIEAKSQDVAIQQHKPLVGAGRGQKKKKRQREG
ncbi:hypothetical protein F5Y10DRAFT_248446 [Nemania abortiva]|nr:hypothetical protein F5Y10DRAFT_248446 [Nemania abortiva]